MSHPKAGPGALSYWGPIEIDKAHFRCNPGKTMARIRLEFAIVTNYDASDVGD